MAVRTRTPGDRAARNYAAMYDSLQTEAEILRAEGGKPLTSRLRFQQARVALRAWVAELNNPEPQDRPWCNCSTCVDYLVSQRLA